LSSECSGSYVDLGDVVGEDIPIHFEEFDEYEIEDGEVEDEIDLYSK